MNVLIDLDGTLTDPAQGFVASLEHALASLGCSPPEVEELRRYIGPPLQVSLAALLDSDDPERIAAAVERYRERYASIGIFENFVYPGIPLALAALKCLGATLFVATSKPRVFAERIIEHFDLSQYFGAVYGSELDGVRSDKAELIAHILRTESLSPRATCMVGDRSHDIVGAKANGVYPVGVLWGYGSRDELVAAGAAALCEHPAALYQSLPINGN